jgi:hypothetical protein
MRDWVETQRAWHGFQCEDGGPEELSLVVGALSRLRTSIEFHKARSVGEMVRSRFTEAYRVDLDALAVPDRRKSQVALRLDDVVTEYLAMGTELASLCAFYILKQANDCERFGSQSVDDYLEDEAALRAAWEDAADDPAYGAYWRSDRYRVEDEARADYFTFENLL